MAQSRGEDQSRRLTQEEGEELRDLLHYLRYDLKHQYKDVARKIGVSNEALYLVSSGRSRGTEALRELIFDYAKDRRVPVDGASRLGAGFGIRSDLNISEEALTKDSLAVAGKYLAFTLLSGPPEHKVGVMLLSLYQKQEGQPFPHFAGWRPDDPTPIRHGGYYYRFDGGLYLVGNTLATGYPRLVSVQPEPNQDDNWFGMVASASRTDLAFHSWIYLKRTDKSLIGMRRENFGDLGIFGMSALAESHPDVASRLKDRRVHALERPTPRHG